MDLRVHRNLPCLDALANSHVRNCPTRRTREDFISEEASTAVSIAMQPWFVLKYGLIAISVLSSGACVSQEHATVPMPVTNMPGARQTSNSSIVDRADAFAELAPSPGNTVTGRLRLTEEAQDVHVVGTVTGLAPNSKHSIQLQGGGDCSAPEASDAGDSFNPRIQHHGGPGLKSHPDDLGNLIANQAGVAYVDVLVPRATLGGADTMNIAGKAIIVLTHSDDEKADDPKAQPSGDSSARLACGVITLSESAPR